MFTGSVSSHSYNRSKLATGGVVEGKKEVRWRDLLMEPRRLSNISLFIC